MYLNYYGIWKDIISDSRDIRSVLENLQERYFPFSHGYQANPNDFHFLTADKRQLPIGVTVAELPPYVFMKDLQPNKPKPKTKTKKPQGFFEKLFAPPPPPKITRYSKQDSNLLLGANTLDELIELVKRCQFIIEDVDSICLSPKTGPRVKVIKLPKKHSLWRQKNDNKTKKTECRVQV